MTQTMPSWFDATVYPDREPPATLNDLAEQIEFVERICAASDFGIIPYPATIRELRRERWREAVDQCQLLTSPTYHLLRELHNLKPLPYLGFDPAYIRDDPYLEMM